MARKRGQGEGCINKRKDGTWAAVLTVGKNSDGTQKRRFFYGKTRHEAAEKLNKAISDLSNGLYVEPKRLQFGTWLDTWLWEYKSQRIKPKTLSSYEGIIRLHIKPSIGSINLQDIKPEHLQVMINSMSKKKLSPRTIKYVHTIIHSALDLAIKNGMIIRNASQNVVLPKQIKKEVRVLTIEEQNKFLKAVEDHRLKASFILLITTGVRMGELLALTWKNVDLDSCEIKITQNLQRVKVFDQKSLTKTQLIFGTPKTDKGKRVIPLMDSVIEILKKHKELQQSEKDMAEEIYIDSDLLFCTEIGKPIEPRNYLRTFKLLLKKAEIPDINIHAIRHTFATRGLESGIELKVMQELLGHSSISLTGDIYSHVLQEKKRECINKLKDVIIIR